MVLQLPAGVSSGRSLGLSRALHSAQHIGHIALEDFAAVSMTWPSANLMFAIRVWNPEEFTTSHAFFCARATSSGNYKIAAYDAAGNLITGSASQAWPAANTMNSFAFVATLPAGWVILAAVADNAAGTTASAAAGLWSGSDAGEARLLGAGQQASAFATLPDPLSLSSPTSFDRMVEAPWFGVVEEAP